jgi:hypothetical protein
VYGYATRLAAAALVAAAAGLGVPAPAQAASCATAHGVSVVVDFHQLGGGVETACDVNGGGRTAARQFTDVGHELTYVQQQPGFVCRVDGKPADDPCVRTPPSDAYWSLWWSDGKSGTWTYSSEGVGSLTVPEGGYVALSWQGGSDKAPPRASPSPHPTASPSPTRSAGSSPSHPASPSSTAPSPTAGSTTSPLASPSKTHHATLTKKPSKKRDHASHDVRARGTQVPDVTQGATPVHRVADTGGGSGLPLWLAPAVVVAVFAAAAVVTVVRRRRSGGA